MYFFFGCEGERVNGPKPPTWFLPHRQEAVSALRGQGGAVCNPARGRDPISPPPPSPPSLTLLAGSRGQARYAQGTTGRASVRGECGVGSGRGRGVGSGRGRGGLHLGRGRFFVATLCFGPTLCSVFYQD